MAQISKLVLTNFRNFLAKRTEFSSKLILLTGKNGIGKTNFLEAITLLGRGPFLRGSDFEEMLFCDDIKQEKQPQFTLYSEVLDHEFIEKIGISFDLQRKKKLFEVNGESLSVKRQSDVRSHLINFVSLTPKLEQLFISGKGDRRDYLDKIVSDIDFEHSSRINNYQKLLKERIIILQKYRDQKSGAVWLDAVETQIVELGMAIASARIEAIDFFNSAIASFASNFPKPKLCVIGDVEQLVMKQSALQLEEDYKNKLKDNRVKDSLSFKTNYGVHRSDFDAIFTEKNAAATRSSTGEQKSIMIGITLARAKISANYKNQPTILIFDEVVSHLDEGRKENLFAEIESTHLQSFFSATSPDLIPEKYLQKTQVVNLNDDTIK